MKSLIALAVVLVACSSPDAPCQQVVRKYELVPTSPFYSYNAYMLSLAEQQGFNCKSAPIPGGKGEWYTCTKC